MCVLVHLNHINSRLIEEKLLSFFVVLCQLWESNRFARLWPLPCGMAGLLSCDPYPTLWNWGKLWPLLCTVEMAGLLGYDPYPVEMAGTFSLQEILIASHGHVEGVYHVEA